VKLSQKQSMSTLDLIAWISSSGKILIGNYIDNIYSVNLLEKGAIMRVRGKDVNEYILEPGRRINKTRIKYEKTNDSRITPFRYYARDSKITGIIQEDKERILSIFLSNSYKILLELLPRGVFAILNETGKIIALSESKVFKDRKILPGLHYVLPPSSGQGKLPDKLKVREIGKLMGIPIEVAMEIASRIKGKSDLDLVIEIEEVKEEAKKIYEEISAGKLEPVIIYSDGTPISFLPFKPSFTKDYKEFEEFDEVLDDYFYYLYRTNMVKLIEGEESEKRQRLTSQINELVKEMKEYSEKGEILRNLAKKIMESEDFFKNLIGEKESKVVLKINDIEFTLDPLLGRYKNASQLFDLAKGFNNKAAKIKERIRILQGELESLSRVKSEEKIMMPSKRMWFERFRWSITRNKMIAIGGKDSSQNESIVKKYMEPEDIFLHADIQGAPVTILKKGRHAQEDDIVDASFITSCYSRAWKVGLGSVEVYWVYADQVSKTPPSGEYLRKGSFMIYGKKNYLKEQKLSLGLGIAETDLGIKLISGSEKVMEKYTRIYAIIEPGEESKERIAKRLLKIFSEREEKGKLLKQEDLLSLIPGNSKLVKISKGTFNDILNLSVY